MKAPLLPKLFSLQPLGPAISTAECAELRRKIVNDPSKRFSRADGARIVQEFLASGVIDGGMFSVPFKLLSLLCPVSFHRYLRVQMFGVLPNAGKSQTMLCAGMHACVPTKVLKKHALICAPYDIYACSYAY